MVLSPPKVCKFRFRLCPSIVLIRIRWSFGGNRLQIKAETRLLADVDEALRAVSQIGAKKKGNHQSLVSKQELLHMLLETEQTRLIVWLYPLDHERRHMLPSLHSGRLPHEASVASLDGVV